MEKSVGACMLAATVWPTSTARLTTMPSMGAKILVFSTFTSACVSDARACSTCAAADFTCAPALFSATSAFSSSVRATNCRADSSRVRASFISASSATTLERSSSAAARVRLARACSACVRRSDGSSVAIRSPRRTIELKSA